MNKKIPVRMLLLTAMITILNLTCWKESKYNPFDPNDTEYQRPRITYLSLIDSTILTTDTLPITWQANFPGYCEYRYRFQTADQWSLWKAQTSLCEIMADGNYTFQISVRYLGQADTTVSSARFTVTTLVGSAVYCYPRKQTVTDTNPAATFTVISKGLDTCTAMEIKVSGATIDSAELIDTAMANSFVFASDSVITIGISPDDEPIHGTMAFLSVTVTPVSVQDTTVLNLAIPVARMINDSIQDSVVVNEIKGGFIVREEPFAL